MSISAGGNDAYFGEIGINCAKAYYLGFVIGIPGSKKSCKAQLNDSKAALQGLGDPAGKPVGTGKLSKLYKTILDKPSKPVLVVVGYPRIFAETLRNTLKVNSNSDTFCQTNGISLKVRPPVGPATSAGLGVGVLASDAKLIDTTITKGLNTTEQAVVTNLQKQADYKDRIRFANPYSSSITTSCDGSYTKDQSVNGAMFAAGTTSTPLELPALKVNTMGDLRPDKLIRQLVTTTWNTIKNDATNTLKSFISTATFHPTKAGQEMIGRAVQDTFAQGLALKGATQITAGLHHSCALLTGGTVKCWGWDYRGILGNGADPWDDNSPTPVTVTELTGATQVAAGDSHSCALLTGGTVKCWGSGEYGQLGNGGTNNSSTPVSVTELTGATQVAAGDSHSCALLTGGTVKCWGYGEYGELGNGDMKTSSTPVTVTGLTGARQIAAGAIRSCALLTDGTVKCWGRGYYGHSSPDADIGDSSTPVTVTGLTGATQVAAGYTHSCALLTGGTVKCWGWNSSGQLGNGGTNHSSTPVTVTGLTGATQITAGGDYSCALTTGGTVKCWGYGLSGALGNGGIKDSFTPVTATGLTGATQLAAGVYHSCALLTGGTVKCWGSGEYGALGNYDSFSSTPVWVLSGDR